MVSQASKIEVAESGNKRTNISDDDVRQALTDIGGWMQNKAAKHFETHMKAQASSDDLAAIEWAPAHLKILLGKFNGGCPFQDLIRGMSCGEIAKQVATWGNDTSRVPFARDEGSVFVIEADGLVSTCDTEGTKEEASGKTLAQMLEDVRNDMLSGKWIWDEDCGLIGVA